jgi:hypothetical protein
VCECTRVRPEETEIECTADSIDLFRSSTGAAATYRPSFFLLLRVAFDRRSLVFAGNKNS